MRTSLLQLPDAIPQAIEAAIGLRLPLLCQVAGFAERQVHALVEVVAGLAVTANDLIGDMCAQEVTRLVEEGVIVVGEFDP